LIGHTFPDPASLAEELLNEQPASATSHCTWRAPARVLGIDPQQLFLDPSDTLRLWFSDYRPSTRVFRGFRIRRVQTAADWQAVNRLYQGRGMLPVDAERLTPRHAGGPVYWLAEDEHSGAVIRQRDGPQPSESLPRPGTRLQPVVPGGRPALHAPRRRLGASKNGG